MMKKSQKSSLQAAVLLVAIALLLVVGALSMGRSKRGPGPVQTASMFVRAPEVQEPARIAETRPAARETASPRPSTVPASVSARAAQTARRTARSAPPAAKPGPHAGSALQNGYPIRERNPLDRDQSDKFEMRPGTTSRLPAQPVECNDEGECPPANEWPVGWNPGR